MFGQLFSPGSTRGIVAFNTTAQLIGKFFGAGTTFIVSFVIARQFGASGFGDFIKITTFVSFFFLIADFGLNAIYVQRKDEQALASLFGLRIAGGIILVFCAVAILAFLPQSNSQGYTSSVRLGIILFAPAILFQSLITSTNAVFQKYLKYSEATISIFGGSVVTLLVISIGSLRIFSGSGAFLGVIALLFGSIATALISLWFVSRITPLSIKFSPSRLAPLFIAAIPLGLTLISNVVYAHADSVILTVTRSTVEVGTYGLAYKVFEVLLVLPTFFMNTMYPILLNAISEKQTFIRLIKKSGFVLTISSILLGIIVWFAAPYLSMIKSDFVTSVVYLRILILSLPIFFVSALSMWVLIALKSRWLLAILYTAGMVLNIALNIWFVPTHGAIASAWITVISETAILVGSLFVIFHRLSQAHRS